MSGESHGEVIVLQWEGRPDFYAVRGHVTQEEFDRAWGDYGIGEAVLKAINETRWMWARWHPFNGGDNGNGQEFAPHLNKGRGCFAVTVGYITK